MRVKKLFNTILEKYPITLIIVISLCAVVWEIIVTKFGIVGSFWRLGVFFVLIISLVSIAVYNLHTLARKAEARIKEAVETRREAERANHTKSEFLANMSHELRTPLNSLLILSESFAENEVGNLTERQIESAGIIFNSGKDLLLLINDILDLSKVEAGKVELHIQDVFIDQVASGIKQRFSPVAKKNGLEFVINQESGIPDTVCSDKTRIEQVLGNFLSNAFKFTDQGTITVNIFRPTSDINFGKNTTLNENAIAISVTDTGIGIAWDKQQSIFEPFHQIDSSTSRKYGGTGLGLSISREFVTLLGGEIHLESSEGVGSTFTLYLPGALNIEEENAPKKGFTLFESEPQEPRDIERYIDDEGLILIIEDDEKFVKILQKEIEERGLESIVAETGEEGLHLAEKYRPNSIILDIELPGINGLKVMDKLKSNPDTSHIPVYVMTIRDEDIKAIKRGAIGYLTKPVNRESLDKAFENIEVLTLSPIKNLLLVEDSDSLRYALEIMLRDKGISVLPASNGENALEFLKSHEVSCMILDLKLPGMSGIDLLDTIAADPDLHQPPVIVYSGKEATEEEIKNLHKYTDTFIQKNGEKPEFILERMLDTIGNIAPKQNRQLHTNRSEKTVDKQVPVKKADESQEKTETKVLSGKKALVVDDDMRNTYALSNLLENTGMQVYIAANGQEALDVLEKNEDIDLVLMDIMMPIMNGYEAIEEIRKQKSFIDLPIIAVTAKAMVADKEECLAIGATDYLAKPIDKKELLSIITNYFAG